MTNSPYATPPNSSGEQSGFPEQSGYPQQGGFPAQGGYAAQGGFVAQNGDEGQVGYSGADLGPAKFDTFAVVGFIFAFIFAPTAIVLGHIALRKIRISDERGRLLAIWALILGYFGFVVAIIIAFSLIASITALLSMLPMLGFTDF